MDNKKAIQRQAGFTLIEIIAVLVILGIIATIAIPKYQDLQQQAVAASLENACGALKSHVSLLWAKELMNNNGSVSNAFTALTTAKVIALGGDFTVAQTTAVADGTDGVYTVTDPDGNASTCTVPTPYTTPTTTTTTN